MKKSNILLLILIIVFQQSCGQSEKQKEENITKAVEHFNKEEYNRAIEYTELLILESPTDYVSWLIKGRSLFNLGKE